MLLVIRPLIGPMVGPKLSHLVSIIGSNHFSLRHGPTLLAFGASRPISAFNSWKPFLAFGTC